MEILEIAVNASINTLLGLLTIVSVVTLCCIVYCAATDTIYANHFGTLSAYMLSALAGSALSAGLFVVASKVLNK